MATSNRRQKEVRRAKFERQAAARVTAARRRRRIQAGVGIAAVFVLLGSCGIWAVTRSDGEPDDVAASSTPSLEPGTCSYPAAPEQEGAQVSDVGTPPSTTVPHEGTRTVTVKTSQGDLTVELDLTNAPCTANSFAFLAQQGFFDGSSCHRLTDSGLFVLQCGDPFGDGSGGPSYEFADENLPADEEVPYPAGTLAMANGGADTNGSQFFIVYDDSELSPDYTVFGKVTAGLDVVKKVAAGGHDGAYDESAGGGKPNLATTLESVTIGPVVTPSPTPSATPST